MRVVAHQARDGHLAHPDQWGVSATFIQQTVPAAAAGRLDHIVAVPDVTTAPFLAVRQAAYAAEGVKAMFSVPLTRGEHAVGTVVFYYHSIHTFSETELQAARAFGDLATAALLTAELYDAQIRSSQRFSVPCRSRHGAHRVAGSTGDADARGTTRIPYLADWCAVHLVEAEGEIRRVAVAHVEPVQDPDGRAVSE